MTKPMTMTEKRVFALLDFGAERAKTCRYIATKTNLNIRTVKTCIKNLIIKHRIPVVGKRKGEQRGYFLPVNDSELLEGISALQSQLVEEQKRLDILQAIDLDSIEWGKYGDL